MHEHKEHYIKSSNQVHKEGEREREGDRKRERVEREVTNMLKL